MDLIKIKFMQLLKKMDIKKAPDGASKRILKF